MTVVLFDVNNSNTVACGRNWSVLIRTVVHIATNRDNDCVKFLTACLLAAALSAQTGPDPLTRAIADLAALVAAEPAQDQLWIDNKVGVETAIKDAQASIAAGRRWFALERLSAARQSYLATMFTIKHAAERKDLAAFEREWTRLGQTLGAAAPAPAPIGGAMPSATRALVEVAQAQIRINYDAGLEYGRNTQPEFGLYYVGVGDAQRQFVGLARTLTPAGAAARVAPAMRSLAGDIATVQHDLLGLYRPPASIDRHSEFIAASSALKEARQYDSDGRRYGAMLKFLQGAMRTAMLRNGTTPADPAAVTAQLTEFRARLTSGRVDHSLGLYFVERAEAALDNATLGGPPVAAAVVTDVLPRYFAALVPLRPVAARTRAAAAAPVTVTLVRWPFT